MKRILLLMGTETYRATDFLDAARRLGLEIVVGLDRSDPVDAIARGGIVSLPFDDLDTATDSIAALHADQPWNAIVSVDDSATVLAARASARIGLSGNPEEGVVASRDKRVFREIIQAAGLPTPWFRTFSVDEDPTAVAARVSYPCVLKPVFLNASRGVIRADDAPSFAAAWERIRAILADPDVRSKGGSLAGHVLVEGFMPGSEVALEGLVQDGAFRLLAFFDKPDPLDGPYFEETVFVTPSRHPLEVQQAALEMVSAAVRALGLRTGAVHAELRLDGGTPWLLEVATRSIGGHCSRALRFGGGRSLEELVLMQALGEWSDALEREPAAAGVMMIPVPSAGTLVAVDGLDAARQVPGIEDVEITVPLTQRIVPLPEGHRYLGFIFSRASTPQEAEEALRTAHGQLRFDIRADDAGGRTAQGL